MKPMSYKEQRELIEIFTRLRHINHMLAILSRTSKIAKTEGKKC